MDVEGAPSVYRKRFPDCGRPMAQEKIDVEGTSGRQLSSRARARETKGDVWDLGTSSQRDTHRSCCTARCRVKWLNRVVGHLVDDIVHEDGRLTAARLLEESGRLTAARLLEESHPSWAAAEHVGKGQASWRFHVAHSFLLRTRSETEFSPYHLPLSLRDPFLRLAGSDLAAHLSIPRMPLLTSHQCSLDTLLVCPFRGCFLSPRIAVRQVRRRLLNRNEALVGLCVPYLRGLVALY